jgi:hypothetical protein
MIKSRRIRWAGTYVKYGGGGSWICIYRLLVGTLEGRRLFEKPKGRCDGNLRMDLTEISSKNVDWIDLA